MNEVLPFEAAQGILSATAPSSAAHALLLIQDAMRLGQSDLGLELARVTQARWPDEPGIVLAEVMLLVKTGERAAARRRLNSVRDRFPEDLVPRMLDAMLDIDAGELLSAEQKLRAVVRRCPDYPGLAGTLASLLFPGPNYREVMQHLHQRLNPRSYLEIGVETGATLALARAPRIIGVDPDMSPLRRERIAGHAQLYEMTSQAFFERVDRQTALGSSPLDLVFIDGLHRYEAALHDFLAIERWVHEGSVIVMHDALPIAPVYAEPLRRTRFWVGDVWKAVYVLVKQRADLRVRVIPTPPSGLVVIRCPNAASAAAITSPRFPELRDPEPGSGPVWPEEFTLVSNDAAGYADALAI
jgi:predicted O-methyltransferase YrrM